MSTRGRHDMIDSRMTTNEALLMAALAATNNPTDEDYATVWGLFNWRAATMQHMGDGLAGDQWCDEYPRLQHIVESWGYEWNKIGAEAFDARCVAAFKKVTGKTAADEQYPLGCKVPER